MRLKKKKVKVIRWRILNKLNVHFETEKQLARATRGSLLFPRKSLDMNVKVHIKPPRNESKREMTPTVMVTFQFKDDL